MFAIFAVAELSVRSVSVTYEAMECVITVNSGDGIRQWRREGEEVRGVAVAPAATCRGGTLIKLSNFLNYSFG